MKHLTRLEKCREVWLVLLFFTLFFFLRLPSLIEPYWYGDEGVYETLATGINQGRLLYQGVWDNKPPLLYVTFALFHADQFWVRLASLVVGSISVASFFFLARVLFQALKPAILATLTYVIFFGLPTIEGNIANAENFMLLPIITAGFLIYKTATSETKKIFSLMTPQIALFSAGMLLGIAFLYKIIAVFDAAAFGFFLLLISFPHRQIKTAWKQYLRHISKTLAFVIVGFLLPFVLSLFYFAFKGALATYIQAIFFSNVGYVGYHNEFLFPQGLLITKLGLVGAFTAFLIWKRKHINPAVLFISLWVAWGLFNAYFSQRPYTHYLLVLLPSFSLVVGLFMTRLLDKKIVLASIALLLFIAGYSFNHWDLKKTVLYYDNFLAFVTDGKNLRDYQSFFDRRVPRDMALVSYLKMHTTRDDTIFLWGNNPQIYALLDKAPPGRYTVAYHILSNPGALSETQKAVQEAKPKYIVLFPGLQSIPFPMYNYTHTLSINDTLIYERLDY